MGEDDLSEVVERLIERVRQLEDDKNRLEMAILHSVNLSVLIGSAAMTDDPGLRRSKLDELTESYESLKDMLAPGWRERQ